MAEGKGKRSPKTVSFRPQAIWRVHPAPYRPAQFRSGPDGDARFSPIRSSDGRAIPTWYGARTLSCAMMETVLHDVPAPPDEYILDVERLREADIRVSRVRCRRALTMVDLSSKGLKRIGLQRRDLIDTPVGDYPRTREWAVRLHAETSAHGLLWISRQDDEAKALVLFGDRITESAFGIEIDREPLYEGKHLDALLTLAEHLGITQVIGL
jgi:RES domain